MNFLVRLVIVSACIATIAAGEEPSLVRIGVVASLTGDAAMNTEDWLRGARMASEESAGTGTRVELVIEDDGTVPVKAVSAFNKLVTRDNVHGVIGGTWDFLAETMYPLAEKAKIPFVTPTNPIEVMSPAARANRWVFTNGLSLSAAVRAADEYLARSKSKSAALVVINVPYGLEHARLLRAALERRGVELKFEDKITYEGFRDGIRAAALKVQRTRPEAVFLVLNYAGADAFLRETSKLRVEPLTLMTHTLLEAANFGQFAPRFDRARGVYQKIDDSSFSERFRKRWSLDPTGYAANGFDAVRCLSEAIVAKTFPIPENATFECNGVTGRHTFSPKRRGLVETDAIVMKVADKRLVPDQ
jgi:ABC-type branched-subunit amino acid transport system substrate-binding protein